MPLNILLWNPWLNGNHFIPIPLLQSISIAPISVLGFRQPYYGFSDLIKKINTEQKLERWAELKSLKIAVIKNWICVYLTMSTLCYFHHWALNYWKIPNIFHIKQTRQTKRIKYHLFLLFFFLLSFSAQCTVSHWLLKRFLSHYLNESFLIPVITEAKSSKSLLRNCQYKTHLSHSLSNFTTTCDNIVQLYYHKTFGLEKDLIRTVLQRRQHFYRITMQQLFLSKQLVKYSFEKPW